MFCVVGVQLEVVNVIILAFTKYSVWWVYRRSSHSNNSCPSEIFCVVAIQVEVVTVIIPTLN